MARRYFAGQSLACQAICCAQGHVFHGEHEARHSSWRRLGHVDVSIDCCCASCWYFNLLGAQQRLDLYFVPVNEITREKVRATKPLPLSSTHIHHFDAEQCLVLKAREICRKLSFFNFSFAHESTSPSMLSGSHGRSHVGQQDCPLSLTHLM